MKQVIIFILLLLATVVGRAEEKKPYTRNVAIVVYKNAEPLDWTGPYEVYNDAAGFGESNGEPAFNVYIVSKTTAPLNAQGLVVVPNYSIENAPKPDIVVIPGGPSNSLSDDPAFFGWTKKALQDAEVAQSVCTGAFVLAKSGLLDRKEVTTWYGAIDNLQKTYPNLTVKNGRRFIDNGQVLTTAGISAGIDGSLHMVARLLGRRVADQVAQYMEYHWTPESYLSTHYDYLNPSTNDRGRAAQQVSILVDENRTTEAIAAIRRIVAEDPADDEAWLGLGRLLRGENDHAGAIDAYSHVADSSRSHATALFNTACEYAVSGNKPAALDYLSKALAAGFDRDHALMDDDLASIREEARKIATK